MKRGFYTRLALDGIRKNRRLYLPYILTGALMVMMYYILAALSNSAGLAQMKGGDIMRSILPLGCVVIAAFSVLFLFYTNSFLLKQRSREFGLYNILGMDKRNLARIVFRETLTVALFALAVGLSSGMLFYKVSELILLRLLRLEVDFELSLSVDALIDTALVYGGIYLLLLLNSLRRIARSKPLELMESSRAGERTPKRTWLFAAVGVLLLGAAYYLALSITEPLTAFAWFFAAVLLVIAGTYLVFIAGSVVFCRLLQKNKLYYYQARHFVSVSSMVYRMKRNGAGLASICILLTMVLVMISSTTSLYFGAEDSINARCPNSINISASFRDIEEISDGSLDALRAEIRKYSGAADVRGVRDLELYGIFTDDGFILDRSAEGFGSERLGYLMLLSLGDYNALMGENASLGEGECLLFTNRLDYESESFSVELGGTYSVKERLGDFKVDGDTLAMVEPVMYMVVRDMEAFAEPFQDIGDEAGAIMPPVYGWRCGFDVPEEDEDEVTAELFISLNALVMDRLDGGFLSVMSREAQRERFYDMYGSLFFLGIMLSAVFLVAAVLIIYYKQICEGYEDSARFGIMRKLGMSARDIRRSVNSQMLTVFFLPLVFALLHLGFAFPFITKIFMMFAFSDILLAVAVNVICFAACGALYAAVYKLTSGVYYRIVSGSSE